MWFMVQWLVYSLLLDLVSFSSECMSVHHQQVQLLWVCLAWGAVIVPRSISQKVFMMFLCVMVVIAQSACLVCLGALVARLGFIILDHSVIAYP